MAGPIGIVNTGKPEFSAELEEAGKLLLHAPGYSIDKIYSDKNLFATQVHMQEPDGIPSKTDAKIKCWLDGEILNLPELAASFGYAQGSFAEMMIRSYSAGSLDKLLAGADGCFSAVLYDLGIKRIHLISDRLGMTPLYYFKEGRNFAWAPEIKAFPAFSAFTSEIRKEALDCFMDLGHLLGDITWFKDVSVLDAATILSYDIENAQLHKKRYWKWGDIQQRSISFKDAVVQMSELLQKSVRKRPIDPGRTGLSLSGGLDSRAVLAALQDPSSVYAHTFGIPGSEEVEIAAKVCSRLNIPHHVLALNVNNWMQGRVEGVWRTDGMFNLKHMHAAPFYNQLSENFDLNLNGFTGDLVNGGSWMIHPEKRISAATAEKKFGRHHVLAPVEDSFYECQHEEPYFLDTRVRRFTNMGVLEASHLFKQYRPFISRELLEFNFSLPDSYRQTGKLYYAALLHAFPQLFRSIPKAYAGHAVGAGKMQLILSRISEKIRGQHKRIPNTNYGAWLRESRTAALFSRMLDPKNALYPDLIKQNLHAAYVTPHRQAKADLSEQVCRAFTLEIWLQQLFNKKHRNGIEENREKLTGP